jgi:hypothetical protein
MTTESHSEEAIKIAEAEVSEWLEEVQIARTRVEAEERRLREAMENLDTASRFLELLHQRYGARAPSKPSPYLGPGPGVGLRDAALSVIERRGKATANEIIAELESRGFQFGKFPRRQVHFALLNNHKAVKDPGGTWHWKGAGQMPLTIGGAEA